MAIKKIEYSKQPLSFQEQLEQLSRRGLLVYDHKKALTVLSNINYYRLSAYWIPFKKRDFLRSISDNFQENTTFDNIIELYEFDRIYEISALIMVDFGIKSLRLNPKWMV